MSNQTRSRPGGADGAGAADLDAVAGRSSRACDRTTRRQRPCAPPPVQPVAGPRAGTMTPDAFFFPMKEPRPQPFAKLRK